MYAVGIAYFFWVAHRSPSTEEYLFSNAKSLLLIGVTHVALTTIYRRMYSRVSIGPGLARMAPNRPNDQACAVRISVFQRGTLTGEDEGYLWVEDGTLFYRGLQAVFRLNREDVPPISRWPRSIRPDPLSGKFTRDVPVPVRGRRLILRLDLIQPFEDHKARREALAFQRRLYDWLEERPQGSLETLLPPMDVHPGLLAQGRPRREGIIAGGVLMAGALSLAFSTSLGRGVAQLEGLVDWIVLLLALAMAASGALLSYAQFRDHSNRLEFLLRPDAAA